MAVKKHIIKKIAEIVVIYSKHKWLFIGIVPCVVVGILLLSSLGSDRSQDTVKNPVTFTVARSDLPITVTTGGGIKATNSKDIICEVEGKTTIISIVDEGTYITPEDVNKGKVLVELDSSAIKQRLTEQEISCHTAEAACTEAKEALDIQIKQNASDVQAAQLKAKFAFMDFEKYIGQALAVKIIEDVNSLSMPPIDAPTFLKNQQLGGGALQKLKELNSAIALSDSKFQQANDKLGWTQKLFEKKYVAETELRRDELDAQSCRVEKEKAQIALELFQLYEFPKEVEKLLSDYIEARRELARVEAGARSKLAQAQAKLESAKATFGLQKDLLQKWHKQLAACTINAPSPGQVVYASSLQEGWQRRNNPIELGAEVRERQKILSIPDLTSMKIEVKVHEVWIDKVQLDQTAEITFAAYPEKTFTGKVVRKAPLADPENWLNPDLKLYTADVVVDGTHEFLKTGMTAKVEIIVDQLKNVITVPLQAVINREGTKFCYVLAGKEPKEREITTGTFNDNFVEVKSGLNEGDKVLLNPPRVTGAKTADKNSADSSAQRASQKRKLL